jgi:hypothetical protein
MAYSAMQAIQAPQLISYEAKVLFCCSIRETCTSLCCLFIPNHSVALGGSLYAMDGPSDDLD